MLVVTTRNQYLWRETRKRLERRKKQKGKMLHSAHRWFPFKRIQRRFTITYYDYNSSVGLMSTRFSISQRSKRRKNERDPDHKNSDTNCLYVVCTSYVKEQSLPTSSNETKKDEHIFQQPKAGKRKLRGTSKKMRVPTGPVTSWIHESRKRVSRNVAVPAMHRGSPALLRTNGERNGI